MKTIPCHLWATTICLLVGQSLSFQAGRYRLHGHLDYSSSQPRLFEKLTDSLEKETTFRYDVLSTSRREILSSIALATVLYPLSANGLPETKQYSLLEEISIGKGKWTENKRANAQVPVVPSSFATYAARLLLHFDKNAEFWWESLQSSYSLLPEEQRSGLLGQKFGSFAASIQAAMDSFIVEETRTNGDAKSAWRKLFFRFIQSYGDSDYSLRQICMLFSLLPKSYQPLESIQQNKSSFVPDTKGGQVFDLDSLSNDYTMLLPESFGCQLSDDASSYSIFPPIDLYEIGIDEEFGQAVTATAFGPLSSIALSRDLPNYSMGVYALFAFSGAAGCALTHTVVIPLDVVKTKAQTNPDEYTDFFSGVSRVVQEEGVEGLLTGAQATLAGYFWYGLSVYPSYTFFKRFIGQSLLPLDFSVLHSNDIALIAGALSAVIASLGLTPLEAARIRVVADPDRYKSKGLLGTLNIIASEDGSPGWRALYAGLPALMTRQVIFGSIKFLAFERASEAIFLHWPSLRDLTWTTLGVSLVAGAFSGALSCFVSQPADAVLTFVAQRSDSKGNINLIEGCQQMVEESGIGSLFRGLGSRSLWAAAIM